MQTARNPKQLVSGVLTHLGISIWVDDLIILWAGELGNPITT